MDFLTKKEYGEPGLELAHVNPSVIRLPRCCFSREDLKPGRRVRWRRRIVICKRASSFPFSIFLLFLFLLVAQRRKLVKNTSVFGINHLRIGPGTCKGFFCD